MATLAATARVTASEVGEIISTDLTDAQVAAFINSANAIIQENMLEAGMSANILTQIELWLAAHLVAISDQREQSVSLRDGAVTYQSPRLGLGLDGTMYGQQVKVLDYSGILSGLGQKRARIEFL